MQLFVLTIEHRFGVNTHVLSTSEKRDACLLEYVQAEWPDELGVKHPMPENPSEAIEMYFELVSHENYFVDEVTLDQGY